MARVKNDKEIISLVDTAVSNSIGFHSNELRTERDLVRKYYDLEYPKPNSKGQSRYVSQDVYDSVMAMHAQVLETFCGNRKIVRFKAENAEDVAACLCQTEYCSYVVMTQNPGYRIMSSVVHDGLTSRVGFVKVWFEESSETVERKLPELVTQADLDTMEETFGPEVVKIEATPVEGQEGFYDVVIHEIVDTSQIKIVPVPPEEMLVAKRTTVLKEASFVGQKVKKTYEDLRAMGLTKDQIDEMGTECWAEDSETDERFEDIDGGEHDLDEEEQKFTGKIVYLIEAYIRADLDGSEKRALWKVLKAGKLVISKEKVQSHPFLAFVPLARPHRFWGENYATRVFGTQNTKTALIRAIVDHAMVTTNPRWQVVKGSLPKPQELLDNRLGGLVNVNRPDGVLPLEQAPLNPYTFQTIGLLDQENEDTTGISRLSQGLNKDAISKQNSADLIEQLTTNSQTRQKIIARNFAEFMIELYLMVSDLAVENIPPPQKIEVSGEYVEVDPSKWRRRATMTTDVHLGYGEADKEIRKLLMIHEMLRTDDKTAALYTLRGRYQLFKRVMELNGVPDTDTYVDPPERAEPPQPDPLMMAEVQLKQAQAQSAAQKAQLDAQEMALKAQTEQLRLQLDQQVAMWKHEEAMAKLQLEAEKIRVDAEVALAELEMAKEQAKKAEENKVSTIVSPNSA